MDVLTLTLNEEGRVSNVLQDFKIMRDSYGNILINIEVPETLFVEALQSNGEYITGNNVRVGAIIRTATGMNVPTKKYELSFVKKFERDGAEYRLYQRKCPKVFTMWETVSLLETATTGLLELVINVVNWSLDKNGAKIEESWPSQIVPIDVYASDYLDEGEDIENPSDFELLQSQVQEESAKQQEIDASLFGTDADKLGTYLLERLIAGHKITIQKDTTNSPNNKIKVSVETINANEVPIKSIEEIDAKDVQGALEELSKRSDSKYISSIGGVEEGLIDNSDPHNPILLHDNTKADKAVVENFITKEVDNLTNYTLSDKVGNKIQLLINHDTYVVSLNLLNSKGEVLSSGEIDLPIESLVIGVTYSSGKLHLTLKNGDSVSVDISSLVSGLVPDTRTINGKKLDSDISLNANDVGCYTKTEVDNIKEDIEKNIADGQGTTVIENGKPVITFNADLKANKSDFENINEKVIGLESGKVDKIEGQGLSTNDYTTAEKEKLAGLENYNDTALTNRVTAVENNKADRTELFSGNYEDLSNKPEIPNIDNFAIKTELANVETKANDNTTSISTLRNYCDELGARDYIVDQGDNYVRWNSGKQECWGSASFSSNEYISFTFGQPFINEEYAISFGYLSTYTADNGISRRETSANQYSTTGFRVYSAAAYGSRTYFAVGKWK